MRIYDINLQTVQFNIIFNTSNNSLIKKYFILKGNIKLWFLLTLFLIKCFTENLNFKLDLEILRKRSSAICTANFRALK